MKKLKAILFDLDGTVTDSAEIVSTSMQEMYLARTGKQLPVESFYKYLGPPLPWSFADLGAQPDEIPQWIAEYRDRYLKRMPQTPLFPGIKELLAQLVDAGYALGVATSKQTKYAIEVCDYTEVSTYFTEIYGASADGRLSSKALVVESALAGFTERKIIDPAPELDSTGFRTDVVMVGDRIHDIAGAKEHQVRTILVGWGKASQDERAQAWAIANTPAELIQLINSL
ncbi:HAD hydrolase-like protein [Arcanobacterium hippocoleae]|uniref:Phosphoglycolate phosphatase n=1 Tax=Arcanobacterium hippocoleae TaxID=149017 RepID=A0ABU1T0S8_9ACTO|nr:HAD hydrolase-like protein [Arcanobacterium hippocoleae]MDR6938972.1 phosphoglycolate phosphatase [Arcanobacterium hippocoleae]